MGKSICPACLKKFGPDVKSPCDMYLDKDKPITEIIIKDTHQPCYIESRNYRCDHSKKVYNTFYDADRIKWGPGEKPTY